MKFLDYESFNESSYKESKYIITTKKEKISFELFPYLVRFTQQSRSIPYEPPSIWFELALLNEKSVYFSTDRVSDEMTIFEDLSDAIKALYPDDQEQRWKVKKLMENPIFIKWWDHCNEKWRGKVATKRFGI